MKVRFLLAEKHGDIKLFYYKLCIQIIKKLSYNDIVSPSFPVGHEVRGITISPLFDGSQSKIEPPFAIDSANILVDIGTNPFSKTTLPMLQLTIVPGLVTDKITSLAIVWTGVYAPKENVFNVVLKTYHPSLECDEDGYPESFMKELMNSFGDLREIVEHEFEHFNQSLKGIVPTKDVYKNPSYGDTWQEYYIQEAEVEAYVAGAVKIAKANRKRFPTYKESLEVSFSDLFIKKLNRIFTRDKDVDSLEKRKEIAREFITKYIDYYNKRFMHSPKLDKDVFLKTIMPNK